MQKKWVKIWARGEYNLHKMEMVMLGLMTPSARRALGTCLAETMCLLLPNKSHAFYLRARDNQRFLDFIASTLRSEARFKKYYHWYQKAKRNFLQKSRTVGRAAQSEPARTKLLKLFRDFVGADNDFMSVGQWSSFYLAEQAARTMVDFIARQGVSKKEQTVFLEIVLSPGELSEIRKERQELLAIALERSEARRQMLLQRHARRFEWIPCINVIDPPPWPLSFFSKELAKIRGRGLASARAELKQLESSFTAARSAFRKLRMRFTPRERGLIDRAHLLAFIKDDRDDARRRAYYHATALYKAIARALNVNPHDLLLYTKDEIERALSKGAILTKPELEARSRGYALVVERGKIAVKTGVEYKKYLRSVEKPEHNQSNTVSGIAASSGIVRGTAKVVMSVRELSKVKKGDVLVTGSTHPDYLPAMRLASAFVTDEGGLTSHAAIVAREMGKPCVVGTKNATQVFKDGDRVEVDATTGTIKKLR